MKLYAALLALLCYALGRSHGRLQEIVRLSDWADGDCYDCASYDADDDEGRDTYERMMGGEP